MWTWDPRIELHASGRILAEDAHRQECTAKDILSRFRDEPGLILADEVGMGKTFVALAVAVSALINDRERRPVVVMTPPSLKEKWPTDFEGFRQFCLPAELQPRVTFACAERTVDFIRLAGCRPGRAGLSRPRR